MPPLLCSQSTCACASTFKIWLFLFQAFPNFNFAFFHILSMTVLRGSEVACSPSVDIERANSFMDFFRQRSMSIESGILMPLSPLGRNLSGGSDSGDYSPPIVHFVSQVTISLVKLNLQKINQKLI